jgi:AcrR family transcriptional regulator
VPASTSPSRQGRAYGREEVDDLLREALAGLMADGTHFSDLSVDRIAGAAGMARSTFYKYFDDKSAMLQALSERALKRHYAAQRLWIGKAPDVTRDDVRRGMREVFDAYLAEEAVMRAIAEVSVSDPAIRAAYVSAVEDYARAIARFIRAGQRAGSVRRLNADDTALAIAWMTERTVGQLSRGATGRRLDSLADALANVVCSTLFSDDR